MSVAADVDIVALDADGNGVARHGGRWLAVPFTLPGERVRVTVGVPRAGVTPAILEDVLRPSPHRVVPRCPHFGPSSMRRRDTGDSSAGARRVEAGAPPCGGCAWQHIGYGQQLHLKAELLTRLVRAEVPEARAARPTLAGAPIDFPWAYRHKVHFVFGSATRSPRPAAGELVIGHYARGSRRIVGVRECPVHDERGNALAFRLRSALARVGGSAAGGATRTPALKSIAIRVGRATSETMATLVLTADADQRLRAATRRVLASPAAPSSFHVNIHPRTDAFIFGPETRRITGPERMKERVAGVSFLISPTAFFQTNVQAADILVRLVLEAVPPESRVLDLYAGAGLFALPLARAGHRVVAVEENRAAVADGEASQRLNRIGPVQCRFVAGRVEQALGTRAAAGPFDAVILDPPREGCSASVIDAVFSRIAPALAVYVSCNPEALARDLATIVRHRYTIELLQPVDMFPHTAHIETVTVLRRARP